MLIDVLRLYGPTKFVIIPTIWCAEKTHRPYS